MGNRLKMRISRMFRGSCRTGNLSDVIEKPDFISHNNHRYDYFNLMRPPPAASYYKLRTLPSFCGSNCPETTAKAVTNSIFPRQKISGRYPPFVSVDMNNNEHASPPASPLLMNTVCKARKKNKKKKKKKRKNKNYNNRKDFSLFSSSSQDTAYFEGSYWFSSDEESDELFSSRSLSSDSSGSHHHHHLRCRRHSRRKKHSSVGCSQVGVLPLHGKVKDSFAVVKTSSDPYSDFRTSMVEMIVENHIFSAKDLEQLLQRFLSLNSNHHHRIILEVFLEIWEALFSNQS